MIWLFSGCKGSEIFACMQIYLIIFPELGVEDVVIAEDELCEQLRILTQPMNEDRIREIHILALDLNQFFFL